jgi:adenylate cyclase
LLNVVHHRSTLNTAPEAGKFTSAQLRDSPKSAAKATMPIMALEIERKFLVKDDSWRDTASTSRLLRQGYLAITDGHTVRVRSDGERAWITIKGGSHGITRAEFEYEIPKTDADGLLALCEGKTVEKVRHVVEHSGHVWEIDVFSGKNSGLVLAEVELDSASEHVLSPPWLGDEVSNDPRYFNSQLVLNPYTAWGSPGNLHPSC